MLRLQLRKQESHPTEPEAAPEVGGAYTWKRTRLIHWTQAMSITFA